MNKGINVFVFNNVIEKSFVAHDNISKLSQLSIEVNDFELERVVVS